MIFGFPMALWGLSGLIPVLLLHFRRTRRKEVGVSSLQLWDFAVESSESSIRRRFRESLHLLLQLLIIILLVLAAADPGVRSAAAVSSGRKIIIIDGSASMTVEEDGKSRFELAQKEAVKLINHRNSRETAVILLGAEPQVISGFSDPGRVKVSAVNNAVPVMGTADPAAGIALADILTKDRNDEIFLISDGCNTISESASASALSGRLKFIPVGAESAANIGITAFNSRKDPEVLNRHHIFSTVYNASPVQRNCLLTLELNGSIAETREAAVPPWTEMPQLFTVDDAEGRLKLTVRNNNSAADDAADVWSAGDRFPADDEAFLVIEPLQKTRVLLVTDGSYYLEKLLGMMPDVELSVAERVPPSVFDLVIFTKHPVEPLAAGNYIFWGTAPSMFPVENAADSGASEFIEFPAVTRWDSGHPVMDGINPQTFSVFRARNTRPVVGSPAVPVLQGENDAPLIYAFDDGTVRSVYLTFYLEASDLPLRTAFPLFMSNCIDWMKPESPLPRYYGEDELKAVNLLSVEESNLTRRFTVPQAAGAASAAAPAAGTTTAVPVTAGGPEQDVFRLWPFFLLGGGVLLVLERLIAWQGLPGAGTVGRSDLALTAAAAALVIAAGINPLMPAGGSRLSIVYLLDTSLSIPPAARAAGLDWINRTAKKAGSIDSTALIAFGSEAVTASPRAERLVVADIDMLPDGHETNPSAAFRRALTVLPSAGDRRVVLLSDGVETTGDLLGLLSSLDTPGLSLYSVPLQNRSTSNEILIRSLSGADRASPFEKIPLTLEVECLGQAEATAYFYVDGAYYGEDELEMQSGINQFVYGIRLEKTGFRQIEVILQSGDDHWIENNRYQKVIFIEGTPPLLYIHGADKPAASLLSILEAQGWGTEVVTAEAFPSSPAELFSFRAVILDNISAYDLSFTEMDLLKKAAGGGLGVLVCGGDSSFGLGGYYKTPLEDFMPVDVDITSSMELPETAILMVIDKSGTMREGAGTDDDGRARLKIDLAKQAVVSAVEVMEPTHQAGILSFDADWEWTVPFVGAEELDYVTDRLSRLTPGGGTLLYPALEEAFRVLSEHPAAVKHMIILSDGHTDTTDFHSLIRQIRQSGITISTVAVGSGADRDLLESIAEGGEGRSYYAEDIRSVPAIFAEESMKASRKLTVEQAFFPEVVSGHSVLQGVFDDYVPPLHGFMLSYLKPGSETLLEGIDGHPLLSVKQYGLGRTAAFTSSLDSYWTAEWAGWEGYPRLFAQLMRWLSRGTSEQGVSFMLIKNSRNAEIIADAVIPGGGFYNNLQLNAQVITPDLNELEVSLQQTGPGQYRGEFPVKLEGNYFVTIENKTRVLSVPYPKEFSSIRTSDEFLENAAALTGGTMLSLENVPEDEFFIPDPDLPSNPVPMKPWLIFGSLLLFIASLLQRLLPADFYTPLKAAALFSVEVSDEPDNERKKSKGPVRDDNFWFGR